MTGPKLINKDNSLANVDGVLNAIKLETDQLQSLFLEGEGAGGKPTASSVISDLYEIASDSNILSLGYSANNLVNFKKFDLMNIKSSYYLSIKQKTLLEFYLKLLVILKILIFLLKKLFNYLTTDSENKIVPIPIIIFTYEVK